MPDELDETRMPLWQHLDELRGCLIRSLIAILLAFSVTYFFSDRIIVFLERPLLDILPPTEAHLYFTGITDKFFVYLQVSLLSAIALVFPYLLYETWNFVAPALHRHEKGLVVTFICLGSVAFLVGLAFAYKIVIPYGYQFLIEFGSPSDKAMITLTQYFSLTIKLMLGVATVFELPVVLVLLAKFGVIDAQLLKKNRRFAFVVSALLGAIITPSPDAFTMLLVMFPLYLLYEVSIVGVRWVHRGVSEGPKS